MVLITFISKTHFYCTSTDKKENVPNILEKIFESIKGEISSDDFDNLLMGEELITVENHYHLLITDDTPIFLWSAN